MKFHESSKNRGIMCPPNCIRYPPILWTLTLWRRSIWMSQAISHDPSVLWWLMEFQLNFNYFPEKNHSTLSKQLENIIVKLGISKTFRTIKIKVLNGKQLYYVKKGWSFSLWWTIFLCFSVKSLETKVWILSVLERVAFYFVIMFFFLLYSFTLFWFLGYEYK